MRFGDYSKRCEGEKRVATPSAHTARTKRADCHASAALLNLLAKRCLCNTVGRISTSYFFALAIAISAACSRAAAIVNFARSSRPSLLRTFFGAAKSCSTVIIFFKFAPRWSAGGQEAAMRRQSNSALNRGHVMAMRSVCAH